MRKLVFVFLLATLCLGAQNQLEWITPFATVEFKGDQIHYYYVNSPAVIKLKPMFLPVGLLLPIQCYDRYFDHDDMAVWKPIVLEEAEGTNFMGLSRDEKNQFLKAFTLQSIWGINLSDELPSQEAWYLVERLADDKDTEIAQNAKLASELYLLIKKGIEEMNKLWNKKH